MANGHYLTEGGRGLVPVTSLGHHVELRLLLPSPQAPCAAGSPGPVVRPCALVPQESSPASAPPPPRISPLQHHFLLNRGSPPALSLHMLLRVSPSHAGASPRPVWGEHSPVLSKSNCCSRHFSKVRVTVHMSDKIWGNLKARG